MPRRKTKILNLEFFFHSMVRFYTKKKNNSKKNTFISMRL